MKIASPIIALLILLAPPARAELEHCEGYTIEELRSLLPADRIVWLTAELEKCDKPPEERALDFTNRGVAYSELIPQQFQMEIEDQSRAIALDPSLASAYYGRAFASCGLKPAKVEESLADVIMAASLDRELALAVESSLAGSLLATGPIDGILDEVSQAAWRQWCLAD